MRIVNRQTFLDMPEGTVFAKYDSCIMRELMVKSDSIPGELVDLRYMRLTDTVDCSGPSECNDILAAAEDEGAAFSLHFNTSYPDGMSDADQLFAVWERDDVEGVIALLS